MTSNSLSQLQGPGEFLLSTAANSEEQGILTVPGTYLDGTLVSRVGNSLTRWDNSLPLAGILYGPVLSSGNTTGAYIARRAVVYGDKLLVPFGLEEEATEALAGLHLVARPAIVIPDKTMSAIAGILGHVTGAIAVANKNGSAIAGILGHVTGAAAVTLGTL